LAILLPDDVYIAVGEIRLVEILGLLVGDDDEEVNVWMPKKSFLRAELKAKHWGKLEVGLERGERVVYPGET